MYLRNNISLADEKRFTYLKRNNATALYIVENEVEFGVLCAAPSVSLQHFAYSRDFKITVSQSGARRIKVETDKPVWAECLWDMYQDLERFLMIFDGHFLKIHSATFYEGAQEAVWSAELFQAMMKRRLAFYNSADFTMGKYSFSLCPLKVITSELLEKYMDIELDMDLIHHIALYNMADTGVTVDFKCAQIIEVFEPFVELMENRLSGFTRPKISKGKGNRESKLKHYLVKVINEYGQDIFPEELNENMEMIAQIMVNSRNRIAHIKAKEGRSFFDGAESVLYISKLSMLYRRIILEMLGINYQEYKNSLTDCTNTWYNSNHYHMVYNRFLCTKVEKGVGE